MLEIFLNNKKTQKVLTLRPGDEGFSLVELVIVIAVLAILAAVAIPAFQGVQNRAKTAAVKTGLVNAVKECVVSSAVKDSTKWLDAKANSGNYTGYTFGFYNNENSCYSSYATADDSNLPNFIIDYDVDSGVSTKTCTIEGGVGCDDDGKW